MIGLMDANNFFVSCERLFRPDLQGKPVAVLSSNDGCIVARSNEVKAMGVPMGLPLFQAKQLVDMSQVTLFSSNFTLYRDISRRVMNALTDEVGAAELYSVDEAFFTLPETTTAADLHELRHVVMQRTGIPVSIGLAPTKTLAKVASELAKKADGATKLTFPDWQALAPQYECAEVWNVGRATAATLREAGVTMCDQLLKTDRNWIAKQFGIGGCRLYDELSGTSVYEVKQNSDSLRQSVTSTRSFAQTTTDKDELVSAAVYHIEEVSKKLREQGLLANRLYVLARAGRHSDFAYRKGTIERELVVPSNSARVLRKEVVAAINELYEVGVPYKKAGVVASGLIPVTMAQATLFADTDGSDTRTDTVDSVIDSLKRKFGPDSIRPAIIRSSGSRTSALLRSPRYTTAWSDIPVIAAA